jgi:SagB-type dehydrogenase family enzyme
MFHRIRKRFGRKPRAEPVERKVRKPPPVVPTRDDVRVTIDYHDRTKHHPGRYAAALGFMDWDTQPDPFRTFEGAPRVPLALRDTGDGPAYEAALLEGQIEPVPLTHKMISQLFQDALGLSAWKEFGEARWSLRVNPSSGNLHPTESYLVCGPVEGVYDQPAVYHYQPHDHALERRCVLPTTAWAAISAQLPPDTVLVGLSSIYVRESWKYGERAFRYCQHDLGHAIAALGIAAAAFGWTTRVLASVTDPQLAALLGLHTQHGPEAEHPDLLLAVFPQGAEFPGDRWRSFSLSPLEATPSFLGEPAALAKDHHHWPVIDEVHTATIRTETPPDSYWDAHPIPNAALVVGDSPKGLRALVHQRRSAVDMDGRTGILLEDFVQSLARTLPGPGQVPFSSLPWRPHIHLLVFVHRVQDLDPGLYLLVRDPAAYDNLHAHLAPEAPWSRPASCPPDFPLYLLAEGDVRNTAAGVSCGQAIAADGVYAVAMLAEFEQALETRGASFYKRLHWEAGLVGQLLYLEAEAIGIRSTGIGCFFDDSTHRLAEMKAHTFQDLYHFTLGGPVDDERLVTRPPYAHLG